MDILSSLISGLTPHEKIDLEKFLLFKNVDKNSKDKVLYNLIQDGEELSTEGLVRAVYDIKEESKVTANQRNAYYQLRYVLTANVEDFTLQLIQREDQFLNVIKLVLVARFLIQRKKYPAAYRYLLKAEEQALEMNHHEVLDRIYQLQAENAWLIPELDIIEIEKKYKQNAEALNKEIKLNMALGNIRYVLNDARKQGETLNIDELVTQKMQEYDVSTKWNENATLCYKIATLIQAALAEKKDFAQSFAFLSGIYDHMEKHQMFDKHNSRMKIDILTHIAASANHIRKYSAVEHYLKLLKKEFAQRSDITIINPKSLMVEYVMLIATNRREEALDHIQKVYDDSFIGKIAKDDDYYNYAVLANLISAHYMCGNLSDAKRYLSKLLTKERAILNIYGMEGLVALHLIDCMLQIDRQEYEYVQFRILAIQKRFAKFLSKNENLRYKTYLTILKEIASNPKCLQAEAFKEKAKKAIAMKFVHGTAEFLPFTPYLLSKIENRSYYEILLDMVKEEPAVT